MGCAEVGSILRYLSQLSLSKRSFTTVGKTNLKYTLRVTVRGGNERVLVRRTTVYFSRGHLLTKTNRVVEETTTLVYEQAHCTWVGNSLQVKRQTHRLASWICAGRSVLPPAGFSSPIVLLCVSLVHSIVPPHPRTNA